MLITGALSAGPAVGTAAQDDPGPGSLGSLPEHVLFIGNSHTARHGGLDWLIENLVASEADGRPFDGETYTANGVTLEYHYDNGAPERIRQGDFDAVVLQGYLPRSSTGTAQPFIDHARLFDAIAREAGARTVFFMTWPQGYDDWSTLEDAVEAHRIIEAELGAPVAPAAVAFERARAERPDLELIETDRVHATWGGAYLAAATVYATLFDRSPEGLPFSLGISDEDAAFLQRIAWETVVDWRAGMPSAG